MSKADDSQKPRINVSLKKRLDELKEEASVHTYGTPWKIHLTSISVIKAVLDSSGEVYTPLGKFYARDIIEETNKAVWVAVDNSTGQAYTEEFNCAKDAAAWLDGFTVRNRFGDKMCGYERLDE